MMVMVTEIELGTHFLEVFVQYFFYYRIFVRVFGYRMYFVRSSYVGFYVLWSAQGDDGDDGRSLDYV